MAAAILALHGDVDFQEARRADDLSVDVDDVHDRGPRMKTMTATPPATPPRRRPTQRATQWVLFGSLASGIGALLFQIVGVDVLGERAYAPITVLWTIQYLASTIALYSAESFVARAETLHAADPSALDRPIRVIAAWTLGLAAACGITTWLLRDALFAGAGDLALVAALLVVSYGAFYVIKGRMAGRNRFRSYGAATALESVGRIVLAVPALMIAATTRSLAWIMPLGPALVAAWWLYDRPRATPDSVQAAPAEVVSTGAGRFLAATTTANAVSQTLLAAGPLVIIPLGASPEERSIFFVVVTAARVPLVFAIGGLLSRLLPPLTRTAQRGDLAVLRRVAFLAVPITVTVALAGAVAGWLVGPQLVSLIFRTAPPGSVFVALTAFGVLLATGSLLLNQVLIARGAEARLVLPWLTALVVAAVVVVTSSGTPTLRVSYGFVAGEIVALFGLLLAVLTAGSATAPVPAPARGNLPAQRA